MGMTQQIGVWIDHRKAVIVDVGGGEPRTIASDVDAHTRFVVGGGEKRHEARSEGELERYLDVVLVGIGQPQELFLFGPGEAKQQLRARIAETGGPTTLTMALESEDTLTEPQIVARVLEHFQGHAT